MRSALYIIIIIFSGCFYSEEQICKKGKPDKEYEFLESVKRRMDFNYLQEVVDIRQYGSKINNDLIGFKWLRNPNNMKLFYGSVKTVGLFNFISKEEFNTPLFKSHYSKSCWENKSLNQITENFLKSYNDTSTIDDYYIKFWERRNFENNKEATYEILKDIYQTYNQIGTDNPKIWKENEIIKTLLEFDNKFKDVDSLAVDKFTEDYFNYLKEIELHASAINFIHYMQDFGNLKNDVSGLILTIETDTVNCDEYWNWRYKANWFIDIYDDGP